jgi:hypothetical protein
MATAAAPVKPWHRAHRRLSRSQRAQKSAVFAADMQRFANTDRGRSDPKRRDVVS